MIFTSARLQNYRSYIDTAFEFEPHVNIIVGPNASGKTNLLDALHYAASGGPMKLSREYFIREQQDWARVDVLTNTSQTRTIKIKLNERPKILIEDKPYSRLPFDQKLPVVVFEPNHLYYLTTSPEMRRTLLDDLIEKSEPSFNKLKSNYARTLKQRNSLLKQPLATVKKQIFAWDVRLSELGGQYFNHRINYINKINQSSSDIYSSIAGGSYNLILNYDSNISREAYGNSMFALLQSKLEQDHIRGFTSYGVHRDDIAINIDNKDMRDVASRGETRSILLTIKITEAGLLEGVYDRPPILLLDDVFGELDGARRKQLIEFIQKNQTFITTTDADVIEHDFIKSAAITYIN